MININNLANTIFNKMIRENDIFINQEGVYCVPYIDLKSLIKWKINNPHKRCNLNDFMMTYSDETNYYITKQAIKNGLRRRIKKILEEL